MTEAEILTTAKALKERGWNWKLLARHVGKSPTWLKNRMIPGWRESRRKRCRNHIHGHRNGTQRSINAQAMRLKAQVPVDTRTFTQRILGDPLPGRSALDQMRAQA